MMIFYIVLLLYGFFRSIVSNISIIRSIKILQEKYDLINISSQNLLTRKYFIIIPLLREQNVLADLLFRFSSLEGKYILIFVTSEKENYEHQEKKREFEESVINKLLNCKNWNSFWEISSGYFYEKYAYDVYNMLKKVPYAKRVGFLKMKYKTKPSTQVLIKKYLQTRLQDNIFVINYPEVTGSMAHQLNYACKWILKKYKKSNNFISIYNADSSVSKKHINILDAIKGNVIQQSSIFLKNYQNRSFSLREAFLKGNGFLQSRWTLAHEIPRIYFQRKSNALNFLELSHVVGHGVTINLKTLKKIGYFPDVFLNEDLSLGYMLRMVHEFVEIYPVLENSDSPTTIRNVFTQYRTWFYGVAYYPKYFYYVLTNFGMTLRCKIYAFWLALRGIFRSILWLLTSFYWIFILIYPLCILNYVFFVFSLFSFLFYSLLSWYLVFSAIRKYPRIFPENSRLEMSLLDWLSVFPVYLTHSFGLLLGFIDVIKQSFFGIYINKRKTER